MKLDDKDLRMKKIIGEVTTNTPISYSTRISEYTGNKVYLKLENLQNTGSFKVRGAYYKISNLLEHKTVKGLICASAGNHGLGVGFTGKAKDLPVIVVLPKQTPYIKIDRIRSTGATAVLFGNTFDEAYHHALQLQKETGYEFIHPFDEEDVAYGNGSIIFDVIDKIPDLDAVIVPCGGGGLIGGICAIKEKYGLTFDIYGVEPIGASSVYESLKNNGPIELKSVDTIAEAAAVKVAGKNSYKMYHKSIKEVIRVDDDELVDAFIDVLEENKIVAENTGLLSLAGAKYLEFKNKKVVCLITGGNIDVTNMSGILTKGLKNKGRLMNFSVYLIDKPGELINVASIIANNDGNVVALEHNQFKYFTRSNKVELNVTVETFGIEHKIKIIRGLEEAGYKVYEKEHEFNEYFESLY